jgi:hypothetical protein
MPPLTNLFQRVNSDPLWQGQYQSQINQAQGIARNVPLVHVSRWEQWLFSTPPHQIPLSDCPIPEERIPPDRSSEPGPVTYCGPTALDSEERLGFSRCVYFYAGRAHPQYGNLAFAFPPRCEAGRPGAASPFDTGGVVNRRKPPLLCKFAADDQASRIQLVREAQMTLDQWRERFAEFLAAYFRPLSAYWGGRPAHPDPEDLYGPANQSWVAWTFEVRLEEPVDIADCLVWSATEDVLELLRREDFAGGDASPVRTLLLTNGTLLTRTGSPLFWQEIEEWVRQHVGISPANPPTS